MQPDNPNLIAPRHTPALQAVLLEMLEELDRICRKHGIRYALYGGTMLGAVRHGGFIPWDDDADVAMLREEYERFCRVVDEELDHSRFYFQDQERTPGYRWGYGKLRRRDTLFVRAGQEHMPYEQGAFLDIFPQDGVPNGWPGLYGALCYVVRKLQWSAAGRKCAPTAPLRLWYALLYRVPHAWVLAAYSALVRVGGRHSRSARVRAISFPRNRGKKRDMERDWFSRVASYSFEGRALLGPADGEGFLTYIFGDYMRLPPEEKRTGSHAVSRYRLPGAASGGQTHPDTVK